MNDNSLETSLNLVHGSKKEDMAVEASSLQRVMRKINLKTRHFLLDSMYRGVEIFSKFSLFFLLS